MHKARWLVAGLLGAAMSAGSMGVASASTAKDVEPPPADTYHEIVALHSGKCLDLDNSSTPFQNGTKVQQWDCLGGTNQYWRFVPVGNGWYELHSRTTEKCLDIDVSNNNGLKNGQKAQEWDCLGGANQHFRLLPSNFSGYYEIQVQHSGKVLDVDISANGFQNGTKIQQWDILGGTNQLWRIA